MYFTRYVKPSFWVRIRVVRAEYLFVSRRITPMDSSSCDTGRIENSRRCRSLITELVRMPKARVKLCSR